MMTVPAILLAALGAGMAIAGHYAAQAAERRAKARYAEIMAPLRKQHTRNDAAQEQRRAGELDPDQGVFQTGNTRQMSRQVLRQVNSWEGTQEIVGFWGCLYFILQALRILGVLLAAGSLFILLSNL